MSTSWRDMTEADIRRLTQGEPLLTRTIGSGTTNEPPARDRGFDPFLALLEAHSLPKPEREYAFHPGRRWRFDYAWVPELVALEVEGGAWTKGRHTRGQGFIDDMEKYNQAVLLGWRVLRFTPDQLAAGECLPVLRILLR